MSVWGNGLRAGAVALAGAFSLGLCGAAAAQGLSILPSHADTALGAAENNDLNKMKQLIARNVDLDFPDNGGQTALIHVANTGNLTLAKLLIDGGARVAVADKTGNAPLHY